MECKFKYERVQAFQLTKDVIFPQWLNDKLEKGEIRLNDDGTLEMNGDTEIIKANIGDYILKDDNDISVWDKESFETFFLNIDDVRLIN